MKPLRIAIVSLTMYGLAACATTDERSSLRQAPEPQTPQASAPFAVDGDYVSRVEAVARRRGIHVQWINAPKKRLAGVD